MPLVCAKLKRNRQKLVLECFREFKVKGERPEDFFESEEFYENALKHGKSSAIKRIQEKITLRAVELLLPLLESRILDVGCGSGFSMRILQELGFEGVLGVDSSKGMVELALKNGFQAQVASMESLPFEKNSFDVIISISALQWISGDLKKLKNASREFYRVLDKRGIAAIQFYPKSSDELKVVAEEFNSAGFQVRIVIDNENNARKRKVFLMLRKVGGSNPAFF